MEKMHTLIEPLNSLKFVDNIRWEQRKAIQIYTLLSYFGKFATFFDFYSQESYESFLYSIYLLCLSGTQILTPYYLFLGFLKEAQSLKSILIEYSLTFEELEFDIFNISSKHKFFNFQDILVKIYRKIANFKGEFYIKNSNFYELSDESYRLLNKIIENAYFRFKIPVITPELFFLTLLEDSENSVSLLIKKKLGNEINFINLKYKLIKMLYEKEFCVKSVVPKFFRFYAYLLKANLNFVELENVYLANFKLAQIFFLRYHIFIEILKSDFEFLFVKDIHNLIKFSNTRKYK